MPKLGRRFEPQQLQYYYNNTTTSLPTAPYGNDYTPWMRSRIVGGKMVPVLDRRPNPQGGVTPRFYPQVVNPIAEKPNNVDPQMLKEYTRKLHYVNQEFTLPKPTQYGRYRPDSKDLAQRYPYLPPIDQNKTKNESSTIFEPEAWTRRYRNDNTNDYQMQQPPYDTRMENGGSSFGVGVVANGYQNSGGNYRDEAPYQDQYEQQKVPTLDDQIEDILRMLPRDNFLPEQPLMLSEDQKSVIQRVLSQDMNQMDPNRLKDVYLDITENYDRALCGWCHYRNLFISLSNAKIVLSSDILRIIAAMFVSPNRLQEVNYEKFLSFIGSATKDSNGHGRASRPSSPYYDTDVGKLLNLTEQQLHEDGIDFERLVARFQQVDREMRETLSADQIKGVLFSQGVKLQESVVNKILSKCIDNNCDGQYNWIKFVEFLEKVQPAKTGLPIPRSKKPLEYAKKVPSPGPNWPHATTTTTDPAPMTPLWRKDDNPVSHGDGLLYDRNSGGQGSGYVQEQEQLRENSHRIDQMDKDLRYLEADYEVDVMKKKLKSPREDSPWFKMFMEFANALYKQDARNSGYLPADEVLNWTTTYNSHFNLDIPNPVILQTLGECNNCGKINIHNYLTKLGSREW